MHKYFAATLPVRASFAGIARINELNPRLDKILEHSPWWLHFPCLAFFKNCPSSSSTYQTLFTWTVFLQSAS